MTAATYQSTTVTDFGADATNHNATMPATVNSGDLLLAIVAMDGTPTITTPSGWTKLAGTSVVDPVAGVYGKVADGTEDGTSVNFVTSVSERGSVHTLRFTAWSGSLAGVIVGLGRPNGTTSSEFSLSVGGTAQDVHWVAFQAKSAVTAWGGTPPSGYTNETKSNVSEDSSSSASIASATRTNTGVSEEITALWTAASAYVSGLIAVPPSNAVAVTGTGALTLPFLEVTGTGVENPTATGALTLPFLEVAGSGSHVPAYTATGAITLPFLEVAGTGSNGEAITGTAGITLPFLEVSGSGVENPPGTGTGALTLPFLEVSGAGDFSPPEGSGALGLPFLSVSGVGLITIAAPDAIDTGGGAGGGGGAAAMDFYDPAGTLIAGAVPQILSYTTKRGLNRVGSWEATLAISEPLVSGDPLASLITRGWRVNLMQANTHPLNRPDLDYLMYQGMVENKSYDIDESGVAVCRLTGSFRAIELANRITPTSATYDAETMQAVAEDILDTLVGGSINCPVNSDRPISMDFNNEDGDGILGRYSRLLKLGEQARWALRETWDGDTLEFIPIDGAPASGYTLLQQEAAGHGDSPGIALIGGTPELRREGSGIINRIIPLGSDIITELDLQSETTLALLETRSGVAPTNPPLLTIDTQPSDGRTMTFDGKSYTFISGPQTAALEIPIGATLGDTQSNIVAALNGEDGFNTSSGRAIAGMFTGNNSRIYPGARATTTAYAASGTVFDDGGNTFDAGALGEAERTRNVPLTLEAATGTFPYAVVEGTNADGTSYWYVEDAESIAAYGLVEAVMHRGDIKNPNDDAGTRAAAANVLYQFAWGELLKHKSAKLFVTVPIANGQHVWALPGDQVRMHYAGYVEVDSVVLLWEDIDKWFLVIDRVDQSTDSGVREVKLTLAAPELNIHIDNLPEALGLPSRASLPGDGNADGNAEGEGAESVTEFDPGDGVYPPNPFTLPIIDPDWNDYVLPPLGILPPGVLGNGGGSLFPDCCPDPTTTVTSIGPPIEPVSDLLLYVFDE